jgi:hypothetical protein
MGHPGSDRLFGLLFLALGVAALALAITNRTVIIGTGLCLALAALFFARARRGGR